MAPLAVAPAPMKRSARAPVWLLAAVLLVTARTFQYFPGMALLQEAAFVLAPLVLVAIASRARRVVGRTAAFETFVVVLMLAMPVWSALAALQAHQQPVAFGLLTWRGYGLLAVSLSLLYALRAGWTTLEDLGRAFVACAWFTLGLYIVMLLLLNPADFASYGNGFIEDRHFEGYRFKFNPTFTIYALFHYGVRAFRSKQSRWYAVAALFFLFVFGSAGGRIFTVSVLATALLFLLRWGGWARFLKGSFAILLLGASTVGLLSVLAPEATDTRLDKFADAFAVLEADAELIDDPSAASRVLQVVTAAPLIEEHPWIGNGRISAQWAEQGYAGLLGVYFFPDDIGLVGMVLQYGVVGTAFFALQFVFAWRAARRYRRQRVRPVQATVAAEANLVYLAVSSVFTGSFVMLPEFGMVLIAMMVYQGERGAR